MLDPLGVQAHQGRRLLAGIGVEKVTNGILGIITDAGKMLSREAVGRTGLSRRHSYPRINCPLTIVAEI